MNVLRQCLEDYLAVRRALGFKLEREARLLTLKFANVGPERGAAERPAGRGGPKGGCKGGEGQERIETARRVGLDARGGPAEDGRKTGGWPARGGGGRSGQGDARWYRSGPGNALLGRRGQRRQRGAGASVVPLLSFPRKA